MSGIKTPFTILAFKELPEIFNKEHYGKSFFVAPISSSSLTLFVRVRNEACGDLWLMVRPELPPSCVDRLYGKVYELVYYTNIELTAKCWWKILSSEQIAWQTEQKAKTAEFDTTTESIINFIICTILENNSVQIKEPMLSTMKDELIDKIFASPLFMRTRQISRQKPGTKNERFIVESMAAIYASRESHFREIIALSGYEREARFLQPEVWERVMRKRDCITDYLLLCYLDGVEVSTGKHFTNTPVGYLLAVPTETSSKRGHVQLTVDLQSMAVHPSYRRLGVGEFLLKHFLTMAQDLPVEIIVPENCTEMLALLYRAKFPRGTLMRATSEEMPDGYYYSTKSPASLAANLFG